MVILSLVLVQVVLSISFRNSLYIFFVLIFFLWAIQRVMIIKCMFWNRQKFTFTLINKEHLCIYARHLEEFLQISYISTNGIYFHGMQLLQRLNIWISHICMCGVGFECLSLYLYLLFVLEFKCKKKKIFNLQMYFWLTEPVGLVCPFSRYFCFWFLRSDSLTLWALAFIT